MIDILTIILVSGGLFFFLTTTIGILRFPDFYSRMHAAGKGDTLSSLLILLGLAIYNLHHLATGNVLVSIKMILILAFIFIASPTATHAIMDAGYAAEIKPWTNKDNREDDDDLAV